MGEVNQVGGPGGPKKPVSESLEKKRAARNLSSKLINDVVSNGLGLGITALNAKYPFTAAFTQMLRPTVEAAIQKEGVAAAGAIEERISSAMQSLIKHDEGLQKAPTDHDKEQTALTGQLKLKRDGDSDSIVGAIGTHLLENLLGRVGEKASDLTKGVADKIEKDGVLDSGADLQTDKGWSGLALGLASIVLSNETSAEEKISQLLGEGVGLVKNAVTKAIAPTSERTEATKLIGVDESTTTERTTTGNGNATNAQAAFINNRTAGTSNRTGSASGPVGELVNGLASAFGVEDFGDKRRPAVQALKSSAVVARNAARAEKREPSIIDLARALAGKVVEQGGEKAASAAAMLKVLETVDPSVVGEGDISAAGQIAFDLLEGVIGKPADRSTAQEVAETLLNTIEGVAFEGIDRDKATGPLALLQFLTKRDPQKSAEDFADQWLKTQSDELKAQFPDLRNELVDVIKGVFGADGPQDNFQVLSGAIDFLAMQGVRSSGLESSVKQLGDQLVRIGQQETAGTEKAETIEKTIGKLNEDIEGLKKTREMEPTQTAEADKMIAGKESTIAEATKELDIIKKDLEGLKVERSQLGQLLDATVIHALELVPTSVIDPELAKQALNQAAGNSTERLKQANGVGGGGGDAKPPGGADPHDHQHQDPKYSKLLKDRARVCGEILDDPALNVVDKILLFLYMFARYSDEEQSMLLKDFADAKNQETGWQQRQQDVANRRLGHEGKMETTQKQIDDLQSQATARRQTILDSGGTEADVDKDPEIAETRANIGQLTETYNEAAKCRGECMKEELTIDSERPAFDTDVLESRIRRSRDLRSQMLQLANDIAEEEKRVLERINRM